MSGRASDPVLVSLAARIQATVAEVIKSEIERLRACPECRRLFLKVTRKQYCSTRCQARVNMRKYRAATRKAQR